MNKFSTKVPPINVKRCIAYSGKKLGKNRLKKDYQYDLVYYGKCPEKQCSGDYTRRSQWQRYKVTLI